MYRVPSRRHRKSKDEKLNLIPILDAIFIFIFFLLMSTNYIKIYEIPSDIPLIADTIQEEKKVFLGLSLKITKESMHLYKGANEKLLHRFSRNENGIEELHNVLISLKKVHPLERTIILNPSEELSYEEIVKVMDIVRILRRTDPTIEKMDKTGMKTRVNVLFDKIIFGNIQS